MFDVVVADSRAPRDGKFIERIGSYNPNTDPATIDLNEDKAFDWVMKGAQPTDTVRAMLSYRGIMLKKHLQIGVIKGAMSQEDADKRFDEWKKQKESAIENKRSGLAAKAEEDRKQRLEAERKVSEARAEAIRKRNEEAAEALREEITENPEETEMAEEAEEAIAEKQEATTDVEAPAEVKAEAPAVEKEEAPATEETAPAEEEKAEEAPKEEAKKEEAPEEAIAEEAPAEEEKKKEGE